MTALAERPGRENDDEPTGPPSCTDAALELAIARRAPHGVDVALLGEIVARAAVVPQRRSWWRDGGADRAGRLVVIAWVAIALIVVLAVGALVGGVFDREQADLSQIASTRPTASPSDTPSGPSPTLPARTPAPTATLVLAPIRTAFEIPLTVAIGEALVDRHGHSTTRSTSSSSIGRRHG